MNAVVILWCTVAGAALAMAGAHGALWLFDRRGLPNLAFSVVALAVAGLAIAELGMMQAASAAAYGQWVRWFHVPNFFAIVGLVAFVHLQFGTGRAWLAGLIVGLRVTILALNFLLEPNVTWSEISSLRTLSFLGEPVSVVGSAVVRQPVQWLGTAASLLFLCYVADALAKALRSPQREFRRKALVVCGSTLAFITAAILQSQLVVWGLVKMPIAIAPLFLIPIAAITYEVSRAIVASMRMEREAARLRDELAHVSRVSTLGQLSGALAHELKQPLTSILANAQAAQAMLRAGNLDVPELLDIMADICVADERANAVIEQARAFMRRSGSELRATPLAAVVSDVVTLVRADAVKQGIALDVSLPEGVPQVLADRVQLSQVLLNLVINAMESVAGAARGERRVTIEVSHDGVGSVAVAVVDTGGGLPPEILPRLFQPFVTTKKAGLGIGLALSRAIVQAHGGELRAQNNPGGGATFRFTLRCN